MSNGTPELSVIVPTFNGGNYIQNTVTRISETLDKEDLLYEIIVVSDGSSDGTFEKVRKLEDNNVRVFHYPKNEGKGHAIGYGFYQTSGKYVGFIDDDLDLHPRELVEFKRIIDEGHADIVVGSKRHPESSVDYPAHRRLYSWLYQELIALLFNFKIKDTQVGLKLFRREALEAVLPRILVKRYAFDLELLVVAHHLGFSRIAEAPVTINHDFRNSRINAREIQSMIVDTLAIFYRLRILKYYDRQN